MTAGVGVTAATAAGAGPGADAHAVPVLPLADLAPSRLDEVVAEAALLTRVDRKYLVPMDIAVSALDRLDPATRVLEIDGLRDFGYDTVYSIPPTGSATDSLRSDAVAASSCALGAISIPALPSWNSRPRAVAGPR